MRKSKQRKPPSVTPDELIDPPEYEKGFVPEDKHRELVRNMAGYGFPQDDIRLMVRNKKDEPISRSTLKKHFEHELRVGKVTANYQVAGFLFKAAKEGNISAIIFWLKTQAKWKEDTGAPGANEDDAAPFKYVIEFKDARIRPDDPDKGA